MSELAQHLIAILFIWLMYFMAKYYPFTYKKKTMEINKVTIEVTEEQLYSMEKIYDAVIEKSGYWDMRGEEWIEITQEDRDNFMNVWNQIYSAKYETETP